MNGFNLTRSILTAFFIALMSLGQAQAQVTYYIHDHLGSPIAAEDENGNLLWREQYAPYGESLLNRNTRDDPVGYTGKQRYDDLGLSYFGARWYDSSTGRFLTPDPAGWLASNPYFSFNQYAYGHNNPYSFIDPDGREALDIVRAAFNVAMSASFSVPVYEPLVQFGVINIPSIDYVDSRHGALAEAGWMIGAVIATRGRVKGRFHTSQSVRHGPMNPGPLDAATTATFRSGSYTAETLSKATNLYRVYGGSAGKIGGYWTKSKPGGPLQSQLDSALAPQWGNTAHNIAKMKVPKGTTIYSGAAAPQSTGVGQIFGGGNQVYIPRVNSKWVK